MPKLWRFIAIITETKEFRMVRLRNASVRFPKTYRNHASWRCGITYSQEINIQSLSTEQVPWKISPTPIKASLKEKRKRKLELESQNTTLQPKDKLEAKRKRESTAQTTNKDTRKDGGYSDDLMLFRRIRIHTHYTLATSRYQITGDVEVMFRNEITNSPSNIKDNFRGICYCYVDYLVRFICCTLSIIRLLCSLS
jgi:hypothetical protein